MNQSQVILVTGASSGIGKSTVYALLEKGYIVYGAARRVENMVDIEAAGANILQLDVTDEQSITQCVATIIKNHGTIDILINNAGYGSYGAIEDVPLQEAKRQFEVNVFGLARITQEILPYMRKQGSGKIINISSIAGKIYSPMGAWYHASKHALEGLSDCLRTEVSQFGITVIIIEPGLIETEWESIAFESAYNYSGKTVYAPLIETLKKIFSKLKPSSAEVISKTILKAIHSKNPKTRYVAGSGAKPILIMRKILSDKTMDWGMKKMTS